MNDGSGTAEGKRRDDLSAPGPTSAPSEAALERLAALAADVAGTSAALLATIDGDRMRLKAAVGFESAALDWPMLPRLWEPVSRVILDTAAEGELHHHPLITGLPHARFLATAPLLSVDGAIMGILIVLDRGSRIAFSPETLNRLEALAAIARDLIEGGRALQLAQADTEVRSRLLTDMSHELRAPLNGILGFAHLLKNDSGPGDVARRNVERIEEAGRGLLSIVNDVLDVSRFESGTVRLDERPFSAARLLEDCVAMVRPDAERKSLGLSCEVPHDAAELVLGDPDRLRQVLLNLLSNAVKFTSSGTVLASLAVGQDQEHVGSVKLLFTVEDSGMGIARDGIPRLFNRFVQADGSVARRFGGSGLGLAISKTLLEAMGGTIEVESSPGIGTRFLVTLSLPQALDQPATVPRPRRAPGRDILRGHTILLAEDVPLNQKLVTQMLAPLGAAIDVVTDGAEAVAAVARHTYALVLMDMEMPVLDGLEATRLIRALPGSAGTVPIVALTAHVFPEQLDLCRAAGMDEILTKPFGPDDLAAVALRWSRRLKPAE
ncbi:MAG: ATP-binding protein [Janthinobacterium lividum]